MIWFTSDPHLGHDKDFVWQVRGFESIDEMNAEIIRRWNERVYPDDDVYVLGDLTLGDVEEGIRLIAKLNGYLHIMRGNHDTDKKVERYLELPNVVEVKHADVLKYGKAVFWIGHYPTITANYDDDKPWAKHVVCLFGHTHQEQPFYNDNPYMYNVGMDAHDCTPITIDEIIADIRKKKEELNNEQMANKTYGIE
jgi:calcineurin-like phosphoesterase family protein